MSYFSTLLCGRAHSLFLPSDLKDDVESFVLMHQKGGATAERAPFRRQLDFWAFSISTAVATNLPPRSDASSKWGAKFADTEAVELPEDLCDLLAIIALAELGPEHEGFNDPAVIIELGNRFAGAGAPEVLKHLRNPDLRLTPLEKALEFAAQMYSEAPM